MTKMKPLVYAGRDYCAYGILLLFLAAIIAVESDIMSAAESTVMSQNRKGCCCQWLMTERTTAAGRCKKNGETIEGVLNRELSSLFRE